jgi:hypothetical protein
LPWHSTAQDAWFEAMKRQSEAGAKAHPDEQKKPISKPVVRKSKVKRKPKESNSPL